MKYFKIFLAVFCIFFISENLHSGELNRLWGDLIKKYPPPKPTPEQLEYLKRKYESIFTPSSYSVLQYKDASYESFRNTPYYRRHNIKYSKSGYCKTQLQKFQKHIHRASIYFNVPEKIIGAVILQESSGNPRAKAKTSSAKGLMQTIDATFSLAKRSVAKYGLYIRNPYNPKDSIIAGTWYLSYVFELAKQDFPEYNNRNSLYMWEKALEYYYAGPIWGKNPKPIFHVYVNGKRLVIKKALYSQKALEYARIL